MAEIAIPIAVLGGMYIISNKNNRKETFKSQINNYVKPPIVNYPKELRNDLLNETNVQTYQGYKNKNENLYQPTGYKKALENNENKVGQIQSLTGNTIAASNFEHNNMVPFFGSKITQSSTDKGYESVLDLYTGAGSQQNKKEGISPLFKPEANMSHVYGTPVYTEQMRDRYTSNITNKMNNVKPWKEERIAPGLNKGFCTEGSLGYNSALESRESYMPKNVDDLRIASNPKESFCLEGHEGPLSAPIKERGQFGAMEKHLPDTYYESGQERWFTTTGSETAQTVRSNNIQKNNAGTMRSSDNRNSTSQEYEGTAIGEKHINYSKNTYNPSNRISLGSEQFNPASANDRNSARPSDYGSNTYIDYKNNRNTNRNDLGFGGVGSTLGAVISPLIDVLRPSRKENVIGNIRIHGDVGTTHPKPYVNNQRNIKTTNRQMHPTSLNHYNIQNQDAGAYEISNERSVSQARDSTSVYYTGGMGGSGLNEGINSYESAYNQTNNDKKVDVKDSSSSVEHQ